MKNRIIGKTLLIPGLMTVVAAIMVLGVSPSVSADEGNKNKARIIPPHSHPFGKSYSEWSAAWWRWATAIPAPTNPVIDQSGENAALGQSGPVWFLAGNFGGVTERTVRVPRGKALFFPILNNIYVGFPCDDRNLPGCEIDQALEDANDVATLLSFVAPAMDGVSLACEIDGTSVNHLQDYRTESSAIYAINLPEDNLFGYLAGPYHPCVDTGYYLMLAPLKPGRHTLRFTGAFPDGSFHVDVTYHLLVTIE